MIGFWTGLAVGAVGGGSIGAFIMAALVAASRSDDVDEYHGAQVAVREHLEEREHKEQAKKRLEEWTSES